MESFLLLQAITVKRYNHVGVLTGSRPQASELLELVQRALRVGPRARAAPAPRASGPHLSCLLSTRAHVNVLTKRITPSDVRCYAWFV